MKVVITDYQYKNIDQERDILSRAGFELFEYQCKDPAELVHVVQDADAVISQYSNINRMVIEKMECCKIIIKYGIGTNNIDSSAAAEKGIYVCNVPDYGVDEVSNHAITLLLMLAKKMQIMTMSLRNGEWSYFSVEPLFRLQESTVGLVGFGRIPQIVAKKLNGFGVRLIAYDPYVQEEIFSKAGVTKVDFDSLCKESDFISIHCPLTKDTTHLFNKEVFSKMKNTAFLVNTARGPIIDENDLILALKMGIIAGAGLDVYEEEPIGKESELLRLPNVIATPHCAWYSEQAIQMLQRKVVEEVVNVLQGNEPFHCVNRRELQARFHSETK